MTEAIRKRCNRPLRPTLRNGRTKTALTLATRPRIIIIGEDYRFSVCAGEDAEASKNKMRRHATSCYY